MAKQKTVPYKQQFFNSLHLLGQRYPLHQVFDDFMTMCICAFSQNLVTHQSHYEEEYLTTVAKYKGSGAVEEFPKALASLVMAMEELFSDGLGNDVLGEFFELHISNGKNGQFFTPQPVCDFMASIVHTDRVYDPDTKASLDPLRILDPACGSGRMLLAAYKRQGYGHEYYGIDVDRTCVKMTAINLFLNGVFNSEVMCANALAPNDFVISYKISLLPFGIFKITEKEKSKLWQLHRNSFPSMQPKERMSDKIVMDDTPFSERKKDNTSQLVLF